MESTITKGIYVIFIITLYALNSSICWGNLAHICKSILILIKKKLSGAAH